MSAVNVLETPDGVMIFTDASMYDAEGVLVGLHQKCAVTASGLAVTGRGNAAFPLLVVEALNRFRWNIDEVEERGEHMLETAFAMMEQKFLDAAGKALNNIWIAGWSERDGRAKTVQWTNCPPAGTARFSTIENVLAPQLSPEGFQRVQRAMAQAGVTANRPDYALMGLEVMKAQRHEPGSAEFMAEGQYGVGGHIMRTDVTREGVTQTVVHTWPEDKIGERIKPFASAPLSRQQRRALERRAA